MQEFKVGGKITLDDNISYIIADIIKEDGKNYLICCTTQKPIIPKVFELAKDGKNVLLREENNPRIIQKVTIKSLKK